MVELQLLKSDEKKNQFHQFLAYGQVMLSQEDNWSNYSNCFPLTFKQCFSKVKKKCMRSRALALFTELKDHCLGSIWR